MKILILVLSVFLLASCASVPKSWEEIQEKLSGVADFFNPKEVKVEKK
tara:strand:- start:6240 stop:6383 length:144 start_codon:yes stop_codon:yes gene_type:complete